MPELPEVETIRRGLSHQVRGKRVHHVVVEQTKILQVDPPLFVREISGQVIATLTRRGKFLAFHLDSHYLVFHLGMTGQLTFRDPSRQDTRSFLRHPATGLQRAHQHAPDKHTHLQIHFDEATALFYRDIRKFGKVYWIEKGQGKLKFFFRRLGLEPLGHEYTLETFLTKLGNRKVRIKSFLLDQRLVAGIGNIYADEALFEASISPLRRVRNLRSYEKQRLFQAIPRVLSRAIYFGGTSLRDYVNSEGQRGSHQEKLRIYGRTGQPCLICNTLIKKIFIGQRGTHFCPCCQTQSRRKSPKSLGRERDSAREYADELSRSPLVKTEFRDDENPEF